MKIDTISKLALTLSLALPGTLVAQDAAQDDLMRMRDGQTLRKIEVVSETLDTVTYKNGNKEETAASRDVSEIVYGGVGETLERAQYAADNGEFQRAANLYQEVADRSSRDAVKSWAGFWAARNLFFSAAGDVNLAQTAAGALASWIGSNGEHRLLPLAHETHGLALITAGKADEAQQAFAALGKIAQDKDLGALWVARSKFGEGQALVAGSKFADARTAFVAASATLSAQGADNREAANLATAAKTGQGECYLAEGRTKEAQDYFRQMQSGAGDNPMLVAAARCGEAQAMLEEAKSKNDFKTIRRAQALLAEVSATDTSDGDASPKAIFLLAQSILTLGEEREGKDFRQRAMSMLQEVVDNYGASRWAAQARSTLKG
ncbi:MAG: hypothetical protein H6832_06975 [Planctomycetes bacterium]|nr:hypothetical protein [Planctomycetota bacterium]MCB9918130.1 hypothetical protein [Planctomycetota bacterium]